MRFPPRPDVLAEMVKQLMEQHERLSPEAAVRIIDEMGGGQFQGRRERAEKALSERRRAAMGCPTLRVRNDWRREA